MTNDSFELESKSRSKANVSTKPNMSLGNDHDTTVTQNSEPVWSKRNNHNENEPTTSEVKKHFGWQHGQVCWSVEIT